MGAVDEVVEHVRLDRGVDDGDVDLVVHHVEHRRDQLGRAGDRRLARLEVDLHAEAVGDVAQHRAEAFDRIAGGREGDAATEAHPLHAVEHRSVALGDQVDRRREGVEVLVLAVEMEHETGEVCGDLAELGVVGDAQARMLARRVGEVEGRVADPGVDAQPDWQATDRGTVTLELGHRVEDHLVGDLGDGDDLIGIPRDAVRVHLLAELLAAEARLVQRAARCAVEVPAHQPEHTPRGEALEGQHGLGAGLVTYAADDLQVLLEATFVDQVVGRAKGHAQVLDGTGDKAYAVAAANEADENATGRPESPSLSELLAGEELERGSVELLGVFV